MNQLAEGLIFAAGMILFTLIIVYIVWVRSNSQSFKNRRYGIDKNKSWLEAIKKQRR